jgi:kelch-like protein 10
MNIVKQDNDLMKLKREEFKRIIQDNRLNVKREECVWEILVKWVDKDPDNRTNDLAFLLPNVRFGLMNVKYFVDNVIFLFRLQTAH